MDLYILACGYMQYPGGIGIRYLGDPSQLPGVHFAVGEFDANHLYPGLPLPVHPTGQPEASEFLFIELAFPELPDLSFQFDDILFDNRVF